MRILITGSRDWEDVAAIRDAIRAAVGDHPRDDVVVVHGAARGADTIAGKVAQHSGLVEERHPADWSKNGRAAGPIRNAEMVSLGADVCLAFPRGASRGTRGCMALAEKAGIPVIVTEASA